MKWLTGLTFLLTVALAGCGSPSPAADNGGTASTPSGSDESTDAVEAAFDTYSKAVVDKNGAGGQQALASAVLDYYDIARKKALYSREDMVGGLPVNQRLTVYLLRAQIEPALLRDGSSEELLAATIDQGLVGSQTIGGLELGRVTVKGDRAEAPVTVQGKAAPFSLEFAREDGTWKVDITPMLEFADQALAAGAKEQHMSLNEFIDSSLVAKYGRVKADSLREPIGN